MSCKIAISKVVGKYNDDAVIGIVYVVDSVDIHREM